MLFVTQKFLIFFVIVFTIYWAIPWNRPRVWLLLVASYYFYFSFNQWLALLVATSSVADYLIAHGMYATGRPLLRRLLLLLQSGHESGPALLLQVRELFSRDILSVDRL